MFQALKKQPPRLPDFSLKSLRVHIRPPRVDDYQAWAEVRSANKDYLEPFEPTWPKDCLS